MLFLPSPFLFCGKSKLTESQPEEVQFRQGENHSVSREMGKRQNTPLGTASDPSIALSIQDWQLDCAGMRVWEPSKCHRTSVADCGYFMHTLSLVVGKIWKGDIFAYLHQTLDKRSALQSQPALQHTAGQGAEWLGCLASGVQERNRKQPSVGESWLPGHRCSLWEGNLFPYYKLLATLP